jgi:hypothetical protein
MKLVGCALIVLLALVALPACAGRPIPAPGYSAFSVELLVDGQPVPQYAAYGVRYVEALKGREYAVRLHNPLGVRVAVALSVDGLNSIDARHTDARSARKWVLDPYQTITISGWQTSMDQARRFYFTSEEQSYGRALGKTQDLGIISAAFFRERVPVPVPLTEPQIQRDGAANRSGRERKDGAGVGGGAPGASAESAKKSGGISSDSARQAPASPSASRDEYAATGIGQRVDHSVTLVHMDLEDAPVASVNIRYEYRPQLVRLGIFPTPPYSDPLSRRQQAKGFNDGFCPDPPR